MAERAIKIYAFFVAVPDTPVPSALHVIQSVDAARKRGIGQKSVNLPQH